MPLTWACELWHNFKVKTYRKRILDDILAEKLESVGAVLLEGPKWCGKTTTSEQMAKSVFYMSEPKTRAQNILYSQIQPERILNGESPRLIDEWQIAPALWDAIRFDVDHADGLGKYILTGSAVPPDTSEIEHTGTGRFAWLRMRPMTLWESGESTGAVSLGEVFEAGRTDVADAKDFTLDEIAYLICRGGWPQAVTMTGKRGALEQAFNYVDAVAESDVSRVDGVRRDARLTRRILRSYARLQGTQAAAAVIKADMETLEVGGLDDDTLYAYLGALKKIFVIEDAEAWCPNLRTRTAIRASGTRYFVDPSIAAAAMGVGPRDLVNDLSTFGLLFETMAVRDLRVYAQALHGEVRHYLDRSGLECDAVVHLRNGRYGLVEIKTGGKDLIEKGVRSLCALQAKINAAKKLPGPAFMMVLTAVGDSAYTRPEDGIVVCPLSCLRP